MLHHVEMPNLVPHCLGKICKRKHNKNIRFCETLFTNSRETQTDTKITKAFPLENDANFCYMHKLYNCSAGSGYWIHTGYIS